MERWSQAGSNLPVFFLEKEKVVSMKKKFLIQMALLILSVLVTSALALGGILPDNTNIASVEKIPCEGSNQYVVKVNNERVFETAQEDPCQIGYTLQEASKVAADLNKAFRINQGPLRVTPDLVDQQPVIKVSDTPIVSIEETDAEYSQTTTSELALIWADQLRQALRESPASALRSTAQRSTARLEEGRASWYGGRFHGRRTASGETFHEGMLTAAHKTLPFGTVVLVTNLANQRSVLVKINDRGPYSAGRIIDLSRRAADDIGMIRSGTAPVIIEVLSGY